jgi:hypothetical protein
MKPKEEEVRPVKFTPEGKLWDVEAGKCVPCDLEAFEDCRGHCEWLSIEDKVAKCQGRTLGKLVSDEKNEA